MYINIFETIKICENLKLIEEKLNFDDYFLKCS